MYLWDAGMVGSGMMQRLAKVIASSAATRGAPLALLGAAAQREVERAPVTARRAAVLVPICEIDGVPSVVFSLRSDQVAARAAHRWKNTEKKTKTKTREVEK